MPSPGLLPAPQSPQLGQEGTRPLQDCGTARSSPGSLPAKGCEPAPCGARNWSSTRNPCCKNPGRAAAVPQRNQSSTRNLLLSHTRSPCGLQPSCGAQQQDQQQATMYAPHHARGRRLPQPSAPASSRCSERAAPGTSRPHRDPRGSPTPAAPPLRSPGGRDKGQRAALKPPGAARSARRPLPPAPSRHSPDSASELVARLRAAGGRSVRRGQRGARAGPSRRTASHAIFARAPWAGAVPRRAPASRRRAGPPFPHGSLTAQRSGWATGCLGLSAVCRWREGGREAPGMCGKAPVAAASLGK